MQASVSGAVNNGLGVHLVFICRQILKLCWD